MLSPEHDACNEMLAPHKGSPHGLNPREKRVGVGKPPSAVPLRGPRNFFFFFSRNFFYPWPSSVTLAHHPGHWGGSFFWPAVSYLCSEQKNEDLSDLCGLLLTV